MRAVRAVGNAEDHISLGLAVDGYIPKPINEAALQDILARARASAASASVQE